MHTYTQLAQSLNLNKPMSTTARISTSISKKFEACGFIFVSACSDSHYGQRVASSKLFEKDDGFITLLLLRQDSLIIYKFYLCGGTGDENDDDVEEE